MVKPACGSEDCSCLTSALGAWWWEKNDDDHKDEERESLVNG